MSSRLLKLRPRIAVLCTIFIILSVSAAERTRCYWCGPLAEQVHRSQRAPSCDLFHQEQHETLCDQGYTHCAIVAVSPPYAESRLCVKFYQDECYSLYCNSTKTWRMVCACRGDLCNGPRSDRESQAFALLPKFTKTKPHKRNPGAHFISVKPRKPADDDTVIIINKYNETVYNIQSDQPQPNVNTSNLYTPTPRRTEDNIIIVHGTLKNVEESVSHVTNKAESNDMNVIHGIEPEKPAVEDLDEAKIDIEHGNAELEEKFGYATVDNQLGNAEVYKNFGNATVDQNLGNDEIGKNVGNDTIGKPISNVEVDKNFSNATVDNNLDIAEVNKNSGNATVNKPIDKTEVYKNIGNATVANNHGDVEVDKNHGNAEVDNNLGNAEVNNKFNKSGTGEPAIAGMDKQKVAVAETIKESHASAVTAAASMKTTIENALAVLSSPTPGKMPPAEALQQNVTPTKAIELTTIGTVAMSTDNRIEITTTEANTRNTNKKNSGTQILTHLIVFVLPFLVHYCVYSI